VSLLLAAGGHAHGHLELGFSVGALALRVLLLAAVPVVAVFAVLRGFLGEPSKFTTVAVAMAAAAAAALELLLSGGLNLPEQVIPLLLAGLVLPVYLALSKDERFAKAVAFGRRFAPAVVAVVAVLAVVQFGLAWFARADVARTAILLHTGVLLALVALVWFAVARPRGRVVTMGTRVGAALLGVGLLAGTAQAITLRAPDPVPGVATEARLEIGGTAVDVLVVPNLPGWNLVHVSSTTAAVGTSETDVAPAKPMAGTTGAWLPVELPAGRSDVWVRDAGVAGTISTDTGGAGTAPEAFVGDDGPECVSAVLGRMLAAGTAVGVDCPSERLAPLDADTLRSMVDSLAEQGHDRVALATDRSPRGTAAATAVRAAAAARGVELVEPGTAGAPLLVTSGWTAAEALMRQVAAGDVASAGTYLAPWLFGAPMPAEDQHSNQDADQHVGMRFDVSDEPFQRYRADLRNYYPGQAASAVGYRAWLTERNQRDESEAGGFRLLRPSVSTVE
jgi:hypothetical protein